MPSINDKSSNRKTKILGMPIGTASNRLRKSIMFDLVQKAHLDICYHCKNKIMTLAEFSIEHKNPWQLSDDPIGLFFELSNIGFSHHSCNCSRGIRKNKKYDCAHDQKIAKDRRTYPQRMKARDAWRNRRRAAGLPYT